MRGQIGKVDCRISSPLWCLHGDASTRVGETDGDVTGAADGRELESVRLTGAGCRVISWRLICTGHISPD